MNQATPIGDPKPASPRSPRRNQCRGRRNRRGVRIMIWTAALFLAFNIAGGMLVDRYLPQVRFPSAHEHLAKLDRRVQNGNSPDVLAFGSSRFVSYLPEHLLEESFRNETGIDAGVQCCSVPAGDLIATRLLLAECVRHGAKPRFALIEIAPESLNRYNGWLHYHTSRQLGWAEFPYLVPDVFGTQHTGLYLQVLVAPMLTYRERLVGAAQQWALSWTGPGSTQATVAAPAMNDANGAGPTASPKAERTSAERENAERKNAERKNAEREDSIAGQRDVKRWLRHYDVGGYPIRCLNEILAQCEREGIVPIFIGTPVTTFHRECYIPAIEEKFLAHLHKLTQAGRCQFHDFRTVLPDAMFCDIHHGKPPADKVFSEIIAREVLAPQYRSLRPVEGVPVSRPKGD